MIYINKAVTLHHLSTVLTVAQAIGADRFCLWFHPEARTRDRVRLQARFQAFTRNCENVEPVTLHDGKPDEEHPKVFVLSSDSLAKIGLLFLKLNRFCDSVAAYRTGQPEFVCAAVFHERMTLFNDDPKIATILAGQGIQITRTPPTWW